jgi:hypothetical protein
MKASRSARTFTIGQTARPAIVAMASKLPAAKSRDDDARNVRPVIRPCMVRPCFPIPVRAQSPLHRGRVHLPVHIALTPSSTGKDVKRPSCLGISQWQTKCLSKIQYGQESKVCILEAQAVPNEQNQLRRCSTTTGGFSKLLDDDLIHSHAYYFLNRTWTPGRKRIGLRVDLTAAPCL